MSTIAFTCPNCEKAIKVSDKYAGKRGKCPGCAGPVLVPANRRSEAASESQSEPTGRGVPRGIAAMILGGVATSILVTLAAVVSVIRADRSGSDDAEASVPLSPKNVAKDDAELHPAVAMTYKVSGGAWLTRKSGTSEVVRGLKIYLIPSPIRVDVSDVESAQGALRSGLEKIIEEREKAVVARDKGLASREKYKNEKPSQSGVVAAVSEKANELNEDVISLMVGQIERLDQAREAHTGLIAQMELLKGSLPADQKLPAEAVYQIAAAARLPYSDKYAYEKASKDVTLDRIAEREAIARGETGIDGTFAIPGVPNGDYILFAATRSSAYFLDWFQPVRVAGADVSVNVHNDNAKDVVNALP